jgi:Ca2+-binding RTX toxin-like protein
MMRRMQAAVVVAVVTWAVHARAQVASTCSFDAATATMTVTAKGAAADLRALKSTGVIRLDGVPCGTATVYNTDTIHVLGTSRSNTLMLTGSFAPGLTPEADGSSEIEIDIDMGGDVDWLWVFLGAGNDRLVMTGTGIDVGLDGDEDIYTAPVDTIYIDGGDGDDIIDASAYTSTPTTGGKLDLYGGPGNDKLTGTVRPNYLYGQDGDDTLYGGDGIDRLYGGPGNDILYGGPGNDRFFAEPTLDGNDILRGGTGSDMADYGARTNPLNLTLGNGAADDGEAGEADDIVNDVEDARGGSGDDVLVGNSRNNTLIGEDGDNEIHGGAGNDILQGDIGADILFGDDGNDFLSGSSGNDTLTGGAGSDTIYGHEGDDLIFNADGEADTVFCDIGIDDAEPDPLDTLDRCEL